MGSLCLWHNSSKIRFEKNLKLHLQKLQESEGEILEKAQEKYEKFMDRHRNKDCSIPSFDNFNIQDIIENKEDLTDGAHN